MLNLTMGPNEKRDFKQPITGDTVASAVWSIAPSATLGASVNTSTDTTVRVSGVTANATYTITVHIVGASGQEYERAYAIRIEPQ